MNYWINRRVVVTGGHGFLGKHVCALLEAQGAFVFAPRSAAYDLRIRTSCEMALTRFPKTDVVIHLAATVGGIGATGANPAGSFYDNLAMGINMIHSAHQNRVGKFICMGSVCAYPLDAPVPTPESSLWDGYPEETNAPYGIAKRVLHTMLDAYHKQYGMKSVYLLMANLYGPGDDFNDDTSHVIPALIKKCLNAKQQGMEGISVWGSGNVSRDFLYVKDAAQGVLMAAEQLDAPEPVNLASGQEVYISSLVDMVKDATGFTGQTAYDRSKPDGQPRRAFDLDRAHRMGWAAQTPLIEGLRETVRWYEGNA